MPPDRARRRRRRHGAVRRAHRRGRRADPRRRSKRTSRRTTRLLTEIIDFVVSPSVANEGEDLLVEIDRIVYETKRDLVAEIEAAEGVCLPQEDTAAIEELVEIAISTPMLLEEE